MVIPTETEEETRGEIKGIGALQHELSEQKSKLVEGKTEQRKKMTNCCFKLY